MLKSKQKRNIIAVILLTLSVVLIIALSQFNVVYWFKSVTIAHYSNLHTLGYSDEEIKSINQLEENDILAIIDLDHYVLKIVKHYTVENYPELTVLGYSDESIDTINTLDPVIIDVLIKQSTTIDYQTWMNTEYFLLSRFERYLSYQVKNPNMSLRQSVEMVNANRDQTFYVDIQAADPSKGNLVLVNKYYYLDKSFVPSNLVNTKGCGKKQLVQEAATAFNSMCQVMTDLGMNLTTTTAYRSYDFQAYLYDYYLSKDSQAVVDLTSARPGHSEHQTGLVVDIVKYSTTRETFIGSDEYNWLIANAYKYGFALRYGSDKTDVTGYSYEAWHYRYVGAEVATFMHDHNLTLDEYYAYYVIQE